MANKFEENKSSGEYTKLYRGVWADRLENGDELPVGGSIFTTELTEKLKLDFEKFDDRLQNFTSDILADNYHKGEDGIRKWVESLKSDIDPALYYICYQVQAVVDKLLQTDRDTDQGARLKKYNGSAPNLSDFVGASLCAERAALGQYLLQKLDLESAYMSGIAMNNAENEEESPEDHSFLVVKGRNGEPLIFDIARPISQHRYPRVLATDSDFSAELFEGQDDLLVKAHDSVTRQDMYFGVGDHEEGYHKVKGK